VGVACVAVVVVSALASLLLLLLLVLLLLLLLLLRVNLAHVRLGNLRQTEVAHQRRSGRCWVQLRYQRRNLRANAPS